jgi:hypothetical protein
MPLGPTATRPSAPVLLLAVARRLSLALLNVICTVYLYLACNNSENAKTLPAKLGQTWMKE